MSIEEHLAAKEIGQMDSQARLHMNDHVGTVDVEVSNYLLISSINHLKKGEDVLMLFLHHTTSGQ